MSAFLKKLTSKGTWRQVFVRGPLPLLGFCFWGGKAIFVGLESGQIHRVLLLYMLSTQPDPLPPCYTLYRLYRPVLIHTGKGGGREGRGAIVHKAGSKYQHVTNYLQSTNYFKHQ
jgi:hypothetical protein